MNILKRLTGAAPLMLALLLAGCGGGENTDIERAHAAQDSGAGQTPQAIDTAPFIKLAQDEAGCADLRNRLWLIDGKEVYWDRAGSKCPDRGWSQKLYGTTPQALLCSLEDSIAGPMGSCANDTARALFDTITKHGDAPNLGLDASHKVEAIPFLPASGTAMAFQTVVKAYQSGIKDTQNIVVRDHASWEKLWIAHNPAMPDMPVIDFTRQMVVGVFAGEGKLSCGSDLAIVQVGSKDGKVVVDYEERVFPRPEVCLTVLTEPMHLVVLERADAPVEFVKHTVTTVMAIALDDTNKSGVHTPGEVVVKDAAGWAALWAGHARKDRVLPEVDFGRDMVVGIFLGELAGGCPEIRIDSIVDDKTKRTVRYSVVQSSAVICTADIKSPAQLLVMPRTELPTVFEKKLTSF